jgi:hypothetical protein
MRGVFGLLLLIAGCSGIEGRQPAGVAATQSESTPPVGCVQIGGGELQTGLTLGIGDGEVTVTEVQRQGNDPIGFAITSTATDTFFIVTSGNTTCSDGDSYVSTSPISRIDFCAGASGCL